jgi:5-methylcytosine-specific restriction protein A
MLFTGETGNQYGYRDGWGDDGVFLYTGEGQVGDMEFVRGNRAIRDHGQDGKDLLLFETMGHGKPVRFRGTFACAGWKELRGIDTEGHQRKLIVFQLVKAGEELTEGDSVALVPTSSLDALRKCAYAAAKMTTPSTDRESKRRYYERSAEVRTYVLARASGKCECCGAGAPFAKSDGQPYLEPHHIRRVSDGGPDDPRCVAGVCPNCHREAHHGANRAAINTRLARDIALREAEKPFPL